MSGEPAGILSQRKKEGSRERYFSPNQLNEFNQLNPFSELNQVNKEIENFPILKKGLQFFSGPSARCILFAPAHCK
jgi:hypothetical protein